MSLLCAQKPFRTAKFAALLVPADQANPGFAVDPGSCDTTNAGERYVAYEYDYAESDYDIGLFETEQNDLAYCPFYCSLLTEETHQESNTTIPDKHEVQLF
jgi:hypothetical protein